MNLRKSSRPSLKKRRTLSKCCSRQLCPLPSPSLCPHRRLQQPCLVQSDPEPGRRPSNNDPKMLVNNSRRPEQDDCVRRRDRPRPRSRSPRRSRDAGSSSYDRHNRHESTPDDLGLRHGAPVYVVDVKQWKMWTRSRNGWSLGWCAGNESA